ncbi:hypothetical protein KAR91_67360 [Candidatus Pacearchaeota archaeon]|nr:hypothetical protein [Candidatus Pacearchaeota archaeon]
MDSLLCSDNFEIFRKVSQQLMISFVLGTLTTHLEESPEPCIVEEEEAESELSPSRSGYIKNKTIEVLQIVQNKNGKWLYGEYQGGKSLSEFMCEHGHIWITKISNVQTGRWCPHCAKASTAIRTRRVGLLRRLNKQINYYNSDQYIFDHVNKQIRNAHSKITVTKEHKRSIARAWYHRNAHRTRGAARQRHKDKYKNDLSYRVNELIKSQLRKCMVKDRPIGKYYDVLGYTTDDLLSHLESLFADGMSWENQGKWHIDHRTPKSWFNLLNADGSINYKEVRECWSLKNLQPLWAVDNIAKGNRYTS